MDSGLNVNIGALSLFLLLALASQSCRAEEPVASTSVVWTEQSLDYSLELRLLKKLDGVVWAQAWLNETQLLVSLRQGQLVSLTFNQSRDQLIRSQVIRLPVKVWAKGQAGLLDIIKGKNDWFYITYVRKVNGQGATSLARTKFTTDAAGELEIDNWQSLMKSDALSKTNRHFGSRVAFDNRGHLFVSIGDRGVRESGQQLNNQAGSILRLNTDGGIPKDNPFVEQAAANAAIYSYGHRNPQGMAFDPKFNRLWAIEHGPRGGDELNLIIAGANYGWPITSHGQEYWGPVAVGESKTAEGIQSPVRVYVPSIAPGSLMIYQSSTFSKWTGDLFTGALKLQHLNRIVIDDKGFPVNEERLLLGFGQRIRSISTGPDGYLYIGTDSGGIYKLTTQK